MYMSKYTLLTCENTHDIDVRTYALYNLYLYAYALYTFEHLPFVPVNLCLLYLWTYAFCVCDHMPYVFVCMYL